MGSGSVPVRYVNLAFKDIITLAFRASYHMPLFHSMISAICDYKSIHHPCHVVVGHISSVVGTLSCDLEFESLESHVGAHIQERLFPLLRHLSYVPRGHCSHVTYSSHDNSYAPIERIENLPLSMICRSGIFARGQVGRHSR